MYRLEKFSGGISRADDWDRKYAEEEIGRVETSALEKQGFWPLLQAQLRPDGQYLDVGCGAGEWLLFLRQQGYTVAGCDVSEYVVQRLREVDSTLDVQVGSIVALPYSEEIFDGVLALGVLEYVEEDVVRALREVRRTLKNGGFIFVEVPVLNVLRRLVYVPLKRLEKILGQRQGRTPQFSNYLFTVGELKTLLIEQGFTVEVIQPHELPETDRHYGLWVDYKILRGGNQYRLNWLGQIVKRVANMISPWVASTGVIVVARKRNEAQGSKSKA